MIFLPIDADEKQNDRFREIPDCIPILSVYPAYYQKVGFHPPWLGYFVSIDGKEIVGVAGFKGPPKNGTIEIAYGTFRQFEGQGIGTAICRELVSIALKTAPHVRITARTLQDGFASMAILRKNGFDCLGIVTDEEDGNVLEWEYRKNDSRMSSY